MKNMIVPVSVAVAIVGCVLAVSANGTTSKIHQDLHQERYQRLLAEEQLNKSQMTVKSLQSELEETRDKLAGIKEILDKGQSDLKSQINQMQQENQALMTQLQQMQAAPAPQQEPVPPVSQ